MSKCGARYDKQSAVCNDPEPNTVERQQFYGRVAAAVITFRGRPIGGRESGWILDGFWMDGQILAVCAPPVYMPHSLEISMPVH